MCNVCIKLLNWNNLLQHVLNFWQIKIDFQHFTSDLALKKYNKDILCDFD